MGELRPNEQGLRRDRAVHSVAVLVLLPGGDGGDWAQWDQMAQTDML